MINIPNFLLAYPSQGYVFVALPLWAWLAVVLCFGVLLVRYFRRR